MKKLSLIIALILCITIGGVYATWYYSGETNVADVSEPITINLEDAQTVGSHGAYELIVDKGTAKTFFRIDQLDDNHTAGLVCAGTVKIVFTPSAHASSEIKSGNFDTKIYFTGNFDTLTYETKSIFKTVEAKDATELLMAVANDTRILLTGDEYNLSQVDLSKINNPYIKPGEYCENEIVISSVQNLIIEGKEDCDIQLVTEEAYANVLCFDNCQKIGLINFTAGHKVEKGSCIGGVIRFYNSGNSYIENCRLYGCGTYGVTGEYANNINVYDTEIYECSYGAVSFYVSRDINFNSCIFRDCAEYDIFDFLDCENVNVNNSVIKNNKSSEWFALINSQNSVNIKFNDCIFESNTVHDFSLGDGIEINNCTIK